MPEVVRPPAYWRIRHRISPDARAHVRRWVDRAGGSVLGSINGARTADEVALTFDDGPDEGVAPALLDTLRVHRSTATFFVLGVKLASTPTLSSGWFRTGTRWPCTGWTIADHEHVVRRRRGKPPISAS